MSAKRPLVERFWEKVSIVEDEDSCWPWTGALSGGYGRIIFSPEPGKQVSLIASRVSWEIHFGPIPVGGHVLHKCDNPPCVRPTHLFLGDHDANMKDAWEKGAFAERKTAIGEANGMAKLSEDDVREIRRLYAAVRISQAELGACFGVAQGIISQIIRRVRWKHV